MTETRGRRSGGRAARQAARVRDSGRGLPSNMSSHEISVTLKGMKLRAQVETARRRTEAFGRESTG